MRCAAKSRHGCEPGSLLGLSGEVLDVGFGSGLTMPYYPPAVKRVRAVDPSAMPRKLAAERVAASTVPAR